MRSNPMLLRHKIPLFLLPVLFKGIVSAPTTTTTLLINNHVDKLDNVDENSGSCKLMDGFAIFIQLSLCFTALLVLLFKRSKESPQRPYQIWALDISKQFIGAGMIHFINIGISYIASQPVHGPPTNLCTWYFLNVAIDTTLGVFILWCWYRLISATLDLLNIKDGFTSGEYGPPPLSRMILPWIRQMSVFLLAEILAKACLYIILISSPWLFWLGEKCISWTQGSQRSQVVFVMLIFPLIMNAIQFWLTDTILKLQDMTATTTTTTKKAVVAATESKLMLQHPQQPIKSTKLPSYFSTPVFAILVEQTERTPLLFPPSTNRMSF